jgi:DEAD/DEAH box helicase domain-containing protein
MASMHPDQLKQLMTGNVAAEAEPVIVLDWRPGDLPEAEVKSRWQQLWSVMNVLLPLRRVWAGCEDMPGLAALIDSPVLQVPTPGIPAHWLDVLSLVAEEVRECCLSLAKAGVMTPEPGFELLDDKGRVLAEAEVAWPSVRVAAFLAGDEDSHTAFMECGWHVFVAEGEVPPEAMMNLLMETMA